MSVLNKNLTYKERTRTETLVLNQKLDFSAAYMAVQYLVSVTESSPDSITQTTLEALIFLIESNQFKSQKQVLFLYPAAAQALIKIARNESVLVTKRIIPKLQKILVTSKGKRQRAVAQALGELPVQIGSDVLPKAPRPTPFQISLDALLSNFGKFDPSTITWQGRSLIVHTQDNGMGIVKFAKSKANIAELVNEIYWMDFFKSSPCPGTKFYIPSPVRIENHSLFRITHSSDNLLKNKQFHPRFIAIAYSAQAHYFEYPNENVMEKNFSHDQVKEMFFRNAHLLGKLTSRGIVHTALIPLFHNRVQQNRRNDNGAYLWEHGGRLDQWLDSCRYPNFATSGLRDFEHLIKMDDSRSLGHYIGEHILSFVLVIGSYFRNKVPSKRGTMENNAPCDTRDLFDRDLFSQLMKGVVESYYAGITGEMPNCTLFLELTELSDCLIEKMGLDENMEEILRVQDQQNMNAMDFAQFLNERGVKDIQDYTQGQKDIALITGPHLGGFSQPISIPALIEFLFCLSSLCISDRFLMENALKT